MKKLLYSVALFAGMALSGASFIVAGEPTEAEEIPSAVTASTEAVVLEIGEDVTEDTDTVDEDSNQNAVQPDEEVYLLAKIAMAEAEGESTKGKALVVSVILNRVQSDEFPDTVEAVLTQRTGGGGWQFSPMQDGGRWYTTEPDEDSYEAVEMVMNGWDESEGALYFESSADPTWHSRNLEYLYTVGAHKFYR